MDDFNGIARLLDALHPWLGRLVVVGGWAHRLHRFHPLAHPPAYAPVVTRDADVAFASTAPLGGDISAALKAAGFTQEPSGEYTPPVTQYTLGSDDGGFYTEFLVPLLGDGRKRDGTAESRKQVLLLRSCAISNSCSHRLGKSVSRRTLGYRSNSRSTRPCPTP